jgi:hypothetical protein
VFRPKSLSWKESHRLFEPQALEVLVILQAKGVHKDAFDRFYRRWLKNGSLDLTIYSASVAWRFRGRGGVLFVQ